MEYGNFKEYIFNDTLRIVIFSEITYSCLTAQLSDGSRLPAPFCCPNEVFEIMYSCWEENPHLRPSFSQITKLIYQSGILEDVKHKNEKKMISDKEGLRNETEATSFTHMLDNTSMYEQENEIQNCKSSYVEMKVQP